MKTLRWPFLISGFIVLLAGCAKQETAPKKALSFPLERSDVRLARGKYLVNSVIGCFDCHSQVDWETNGDPIKPGTMGGGAVFPLDILPGRVVASNISPDVETGAGSWKDEDFYRAMTQGIGKDGRTLFPFMPYMNLRELTDEDLASVIVYIRSIPPVKNSPPKTELVEDVKKALKPMPPRPEIPSKDLFDPAALGAYLVNAAQCSGCHTPADPLGMPIKGLEFGGGYELNGPWGKVATANITPDPSGISYYDEAMFFSVARTGHLARGGRKVSNLMPWRSFRNLTDKDLKGIFAFLRTLKPVAHRVDNTEPPTPCKKCGHRHGLGSMN